MRAQIGLVALVLSALLFYSGSGLVRLFACDRLRGREILLAPVVGAAFLITIGSWVAVLGGSAATALAIALAAATLANFASLRSGRVATLDMRTTVGAALLAGFVVGVGVAPLWTLERTGAVIGRNGDQVFYANIASFLEQRGLPVPAPGPFAPAATQRSFIDTYGVPLGFASVHAMVDRLTGLPAHATFSVVTAVLLALNVPVCVLLADRLFRLGCSWALLAGVLSAVSPTLMWIHYNNYAMHALSLSLVPAALGMAVLSLEEGRMRCLILAALLLSALCVSYPPAAGPFVLAPLAASVVMRARHTAGWAPVLTRVAGLGLLAVAMNLVGVVHVAKVLRPMVRYVLVREFGDVASHVSPAQLVGLVHHALAEPSGWLALPIATITAGAVVLMIYGLATSTPEGRRTGLALLVTAVPFVLWLRFGLDYPYGFYKGLTFLVWPAVIGIVLGVRRALNAPGLVRAAAVGWLLVLVGASGANLLRMARTVTVFDLEPMMELRTLAGLVPRDEAVHVRDESGTALLWVTFFLEDRALFLGNYSPYYLHRGWPFYQDAISAPLVLVNRDAARLAPWEGGTVYENRRYRVLRKDPAILAYLDLGQTPRALEAAQEFRVSLLPDRTVVDGRSFAPLLPAAETHLVALGVWATGTSALRIRSADGERVFRVSGDHDPIVWAAARGPSEAIIANIGAETVLIPGWIAGIGRTTWRPAPGDPAGPVPFVRDELLPGSKFFAVSGWHDREGTVRWSRASAVAIFDNPGRDASLRIDCLSWRPPGVALPRIAVLINGRSLDGLRCSGSSEAVPLSRTLLGEGSWGMLEFRVDPVFVPKALKLSSDERDLGILLRALRLETRGLNLGPTTPGGDGSGALYSVDGPRGRPHRRRRASDRY